VLVFEIVIPNNNILYVFVQEKIEKKEEKIYFKLEWGGVQEVLVKPNLKYPIVLLLILLGTCLLRIPQMIVYKNFQAMVPSSCTLEIEQNSNRRY
jgi:hypothetical protein